MIMVHDKMGRMWKNAVMAYFKVLPQNLGGETEEK
jgi:hypothetical protein